MKTLTISPRFFQIEKKNYTDWKFAFFRELFQNSLDGGARKIECVIEPKENKSLVIFTDDGRGMSREILETVFLAMGETSKGGDDGSGIGGFGKARNLTAFSSDFYQIVSCDYVCDGIGASYEIKDNDFTKGVKFTALVDAPAENLIGKFKNLVFLSRVNANIYLNGENLSQNYRLGTFCREMECGRVYANKSNSEIKNKVIVRVNGLVTFTHYTAANAGVTVEIHPVKSREILSATRDNLNHKFKNELDEFLGELAADTQSALKDRSRRFVKFMNKTKGFLARITEKFTEKSKEVSIGEMIPAAQIAGGFVTKEILNPGVSFSNNPRGEFDGFSPAPSRFNCPILDSLVIYADTQNENIKKVIKFYDPSENNGEIGSSRHKFIKQWKNICEIVMGELADLTKNEYVWAVGFAFDDEAIAMHQKTEGTSYLMINPVDKEGKMKYSINDKGDIINLTLSACHEVVHAAGHQLHNQDFVCTYDALLARVMPRQKEIFHLCAAAKE